MLPELLLFGGGTFGGSEVRKRIIRTFKCCDSMAVLAEWADGGVLNG